MTITIKWDGTAPGQGGQGSPGGPPTPPGGPNSLDLSQRLPSPDWQLPLWQDTDRFLTPTREALRDYSSMQGQRDWAAEYRKMWEEVFTAADQAKQQLEDETAARARGMEVLKERYRLESAAVEAARTYEQEMLLRQRSLEVQQERHRIEGAAAEEARLQLAGEKEAKQWRQQVEQERRKQDPATAAAGDLSSIGGFLGQLSGGKGGGGMAGKLLEMAPQFQEQFGMFFGGEATSAAAAGAAGGLAGVAAAAGPAGLALTAATMAADGMKESAKATTEEWKRFGAQVKGIAGDDYLGVFVDKVGDAAGAMGTVFGSGGILQALAADVAVEYAKQYAERLKIIADVSSAFVQLGQRIGGYSGALSSAQSQADVRGILGDLREAENLGASIAKLTEAQSRSTDALRELFGPIKKLAVEGVSLPQEVLAELLDRERNSLRNVTDHFNRLFRDMMDEIRPAFGLNRNGADDTLDQIVAQFGWNNEVRVINGQPVGGNVPMDPANFRGRP